MGYAKQMWLDETVKCGEQWVDHQDDERFIDNMRDLGWDREEAENHLDALKQEIGE